MNHDAGLSPVRSPLLAQAAPQIAHGFFTRKGGVSKGIYDSLNVGLGSRDDRDDVETNRARIAGWFGAAPKRLATLYQVHSARAVTVGDGYEGARPEADGIVTTVPGLVLGVLSADCGPILFADPAAGVIGAAHAGWKGALTGIAESTIEAMISLGAVRGQILASLGPSISGRNYEVGAEFVDRFMAEEPGCDIHFTPSVRAGHFMFDLPAFTLARLERAGLTAENLDICTYAGEEDFYSYRRTTHRSEPDHGRQMSAIMLSET